MKTLMKKMAQAIMAASIPVLLMVSCESDIIEPDSVGPPDKSTIDLPPGVNKK